MDWEADRLMTARQYKLALRRLRLSHAAAGRLLGVSERTARRYVSGKSEIPGSTALLLRMMIAFNVVVPDI